MKKDDWLILSVIGAIIAVAAIAWSLGSYYGTLLLVVLIAIGMYQQIAAQKTGR